MKKEYKKPKANNIDDDVSFFPALAAAGVAAAEGVAAGVGLAIGASVGNRLYREGGLPVLKPECIEIKS